MDKVYHILLVFILNAMTFICPKDVKLKLYLVLNYCKDVMNFLGYEKK